MVSHLGNRACFLGLSLSLRHRACVSGVLRKLASLRHLPHSGLPPLDTLFQSAQGWHVTQMCFADSHLLQEVMLQVHRHPWGCLLKMQIPGPTLWQ